MRVLDLVGQQFGLLTVSARAPSHNGASMWHCACQCGGVIEARGSKLTEGRTKSCGCLFAQNRPPPATTHGQHATPTYTSWQTMKDRCLNPGATGYENYGGRGIGIDPRWKDSFEAFMSDMGPRPSYDHTLDRRNVNGDYGPDNCRWATKEEQANNTRVSVFFEYRGERLTRTQLCRKTGINPNTFQYRIDRGMGIEEALKC